MATSAGTLERFESHEHDWPLLSQRPSAWHGYQVCMECGRRFLRMWETSSAWVLRRVERVEFLDDRMVRRHISVDFVIPTMAPVLSFPNETAITPIPLALMRRKNLVDFDLRDRDDRSVCLMNLRNSQSVSLSMLTFLACSTLGIPLREADQEMLSILERVAAGSQNELLDAHERFERAESDQTARLHRDVPFRTILGRMSDNYMLLPEFRGNLQGRQLLKYAYSEPLSLVYKKASSEPKVEDDGQKVVIYHESPDATRWYDGDRVLAALGLSTTRVRFPVPAAEKCASFRFETKAPLGVAIESALLLAGRPNGNDPPSVDVTGGELAEIDMHVVNVPPGSLSFAQVSLAVPLSGWLTTAFVSLWTTTVVLFVAARWRSHLGTASPDTAATLLVTFTAGIAALMAQPDAHRMATRLLSWTRRLAALSALCAFSAAAVFAFGTRHGWDTKMLWSAFAISLIPACAVTGTTIRSRSFANRAAPPSPWEQGRNLPPETRIASFPDARDKYRLLRPAIKVASIEGTRDEFRWTDKLQAELLRRLESPVADTLEGPLNVPDIELREMKLP